MQVTSLAQLKKLLMRNMKSAMNAANAKILSDMYEETGKFYTKGSPKRYIRTGALANTPETTNTTQSGNTVSFTARLNTAYDYTTGTHSAPQVVANAEVGAYGILGKTGFWKRSENKMQKELDSCMRRAFK